MSSSGIASCSIGGRPAPEEAALVPEALVPEEAASFVVGGVIVAVVLFAGVGNVHVKALPARRRLLLGLAKRDGIATCN
jgi:hypothetical protein